MSYQFHVITKLHCQTWSVRASSESIRLDIN